MSFNSVDINEQLSSSDRAAANLATSCQGIINTYIAPSDSTWYNTLHSELEQAQILAQQWQTQYSTQLKAEVLTCVVNCGQAFATQRSKINQLFDRASSNLGDTKVELHTELNALKGSIQMIPMTVAHYEQNLRNWGRELELIHRQMADTIAQIQEQETNLKSQIDSINNSIASLQSQIIANRETIAQAKIEQAKGTVETMFGAMFAPLTGGLSLILTGIGASSIEEAEGKVSAMEGTIRDYHSRIVSAQQNLTQDQTQLVTLNGLTFSATIALNDIDVAEQMLDTVRTSWEAFFQEIDGVISKIADAQESNAIVLEKAWFNAACNEWDLIVTPTQGFIEA